MGRGTAAVGGGGGVLALGTEPDDAFCDSSWVGEDVFCGDTPFADSLRIQPLVSFFVAHGPVAHTMTDTIDLDRKFQFQNIEIEQVAPNRVLAPEFDVIRLLPEKLP